MGDQFYGTAELISFCQDKNWDYRIRLKGNLTVRDKNRRMTTKELAKKHIFALREGPVDRKNGRDDSLFIHDPCHEEQWIIVMFSKSGYLKTLE